jgi:hypothetical protein
MTNNTNQTINMGDLCQDAVTGFQGVVTSQHQSGDGITRYGVQPQTLKANGNRMKAQLIEGNLLTVVTPGLIPMLRKTGTG